MSDEPMDSLWRRLHRDGKKFWTKSRVDVTSAVKTARAQQAKIHTNRGSRPHDSRFNAQHRWQGPLEVFRGPSSNSNQKSWRAGCKQLRTEMAGKQQRNTTCHLDPSVDDNDDLLLCRLVKANEDLSNVALLMSIKNILIQVTSFWMV